MTEELKTLKDMEYWRKMPESFLKDKSEKEMKEELNNLVYGRAVKTQLAFGKLISPVDAIELRQEVIKWIKEFQSERTKAISEMFDNVDEYGIYPTTNFFNRIDNFWMNKFNIKVEDLK